MSDETPKDAGLDPEVPRTNIYLISKKDYTSDGENDQPDKKKDLITTTPLSEEDAFAGLYFDVQNNRSGLVLSPPYDPRVLMEMVNKNNALGQCIDAMETAIDGTGHEIRLRQEGKENKAEEENLKTFFKEPYPGMSMLSIRKSVRRDLEGSGNGYVEVIRNMEGIICFLRYLDSGVMRLVKNTDPFLTEKTVMRGGKEYTANVMARERRYCQRVGTTFLYYKEFGSKLEVHKDTGAVSDQPLPVDKKASEIIHFIIKKDVLTPYGLPRWINQIPSVLGSRSAEEYNLNFFDSGGIPPLIIFVAGGTINANIKVQLDKILNSNSSKYKGAVVEVQQSSGDLNSTVLPHIQVERFGGEKNKDMLFAGYDKACEDHVRKSFRLPPLFVGDSMDYSYASAYTSYIVAESQVFKPERDVFDEVMNLKVAKELGNENYEFKSLPTSILDIETKLAAMNLTKDTIEADSMVDTVNDITGMDLRIKSPEQIAQQNQPKQPMGFGAGNQAGNGKGNLNPKDVVNEIPNTSPKATMPQVSGPGKTKGPGTGASAIKSADKLLELVEAWSIINGIKEGYTSITKEELKAAMGEFDEHETMTFNFLLVNKTNPIRVDNRGCDHG